MPKIGVSLCEIVEYVGDRSRPLKEGEAVFKAGHIILCGLEGEANIKSLCLQTSALTSKPHEISIVLHENVKEWKCVCSCKAGMSGFCKHIVATLININRNENLEHISCTDVSQKWGKEKKGVEEMYKAQPFKDFCHPLIKRKKIMVKTSKETATKNFAMLSTGVGDSALCKFIGRSLGPEKYVPLCSNENNILLDNVKSILQNSKKSQFISELKQEVTIDSFKLRPCCFEIVRTLSTCDILKVATYKQGSNMWFKERQLRITGSTCYSIYTFKKEDWEEKSKKIFFPKNVETKFTKHGRDHETEALEAFREQRNVQVVTPGLIVSEEFPWLGYSPDGVIFSDNTPVKLVEIKCPFIGKNQSHESFLDNCIYLEENDMGEIKLRERHPYYGQIQLGMALLGLNEAILILYSSHSKTFLEIKVVFNKTFCTELIKKTSENYFVHMIHVYCENKIE